MVPERKYSMHDSNIGHDEPLGSNAKPINIRPGIMERGNPSEKPG
jgi:hypothetical protein